MGRVKTRFLIATDSFKGTMGSGEVAGIIARAIRAHVPEAVIHTVPMADGGEGLVGALLCACGGRELSATVCGPFGEPVTAKYGLLDSGAAVIEMAACAGLPLAEGRLDPMRATTRGVGELIALAAASGAKKIILGLGGSATNDGGVGMAAALGYRFFDEKGNAVEPLACRMEEIRSIRRPEQLLEMRVTAACDVSNPLCGPLGATAVFGPQKGVTDETHGRLERGLCALADAMQRSLGRSVLSLPGGGAAGGLGAAVAGFLDGELRPGIELVLDAANVDALLGETDVVFTGEGRIDGQSVFGKVPVGVARRARAKGVPCFALCGSVGEGAEAVYREGITAVYSAVRRAADFDGIRKTCREDMAFLADAVVRTLLLD